MALGRVFKLFIHLFYCGPCGVSVAAHRLSSAEASRGCSLAVVCRLLISVAFPAAEHRLQSAQASVLAAGRLSRWSDRLSCSTACGVFLDQELSPCPLHWQADSLPLDHQGSTSPNSIKFCIKRNIFKINAKRLNTVVFFNSFT